MRKVLLHFSVQLLVYIYIYTTYLIAKLPSSPSSPYPPWSVPGIWRQGVQHTQQEVRLLQINERAAWETRAKHCVGMFHMIP